MDQQNLSQQNQAIDYTQFPDAQG
ncbi:MAG: hypothetical protein RIQ74_575, partial [Pseudomonadota bacterium]